MTSFAELLSQGVANAWFFVPTAVLLGALHGLEPGHSKTMMAAFIVAIRGSVAQAVLLGLAATASHTVIVWIIALGGMHLWRGIAPETFEPWLQLVSGLIILGMSIWMLWRAAHNRIQGGSDCGHDHNFPHQHQHGHNHDHDREGSGRHPHRDDALREDAHACAHAEHLRRHVVDQRVTNWQILVFGLTGGMIPCPAAITVLLLCLQVRELTLGAALVLCFSIGLAITLVCVGAAAALSLRYATRRASWFSDLAGRAPYFSGALMALVGLYVMTHGALVLTGR